MISTPTEEYTTSHWVAIQKEILHNPPFVFFLGRGGGNALEFPPGGGIRTFLKIHPNFALKRQLLGNSC